MAIVFVCNQICIQILEHYPYVKKHEREGKKEKVNQQRASSLQIHFFCFCFLLLYISSYTGERKMFVFRVI